MGLALLSDTGAPGFELTGTGQLMGTVDYMAPEQATDTHNVDIRADVYALGATLFKLLTGEVLYTGQDYDTAMKKIIALVHEPSPSIQERRPDLPPELIALIDRMMSKQRDDRPSTPDEVAEALAPFALGHNIAGLAEGRKPSENENRQAFIDTTNGQETAPLEPSIDPISETAKLGTTEGIKPPAITVGGRNRRRNSTPWKWIGITTGSLLAVLAITSGIVFFFQAPEDATVRVEINDPTIELTIKGPDFHIQGKEDIKLTPGKQTLKVKRGDFEFETDKLVLKDGETVTLQIELLPGKVQVVSAGKVIDERPFPDPITFPPGKSPETKIEDLASRGQVDLPPANVRRTPSGLHWPRLSHLASREYGRFTDSPQNMEAFGQTSRCNKVGDLDGDGDLDVFVGMDGPNQILINQGGMQHGEPGLLIDSGQKLLPAFIESKANFSYDCDIGDLDGDGDLDAFCANFNRANVVWINQGGLQKGVEGVFESTDQEDISPTLTSVGVALGDLDGDTDLDVFLINSNNAEIWINQGNDQQGDLGRFALKLQLETLGSNFCVCLGDVDMDGDLDALTSSTGHPNQIFLNQGGIQKGEKGHFLDSGQRLGVAKTSKSHAVKFADLDQDGDLDLFVANNGPNQVWINLGGKQKGTIGEFADMGQRLGDLDSWGVALGDIDLDGDIDAYVGNFSRPNKVWLNDGNGKFSDTEESLANHNTYQVSLADFDGDGDLDGYTSNAVGFDNRLWINQTNKIIGLPDLTLETNSPPTVINLQEVFEHPVNAAEELTFSIIGNSTPRLFSKLAIDKGTLNIHYADTALGVSEITVRATDTGAEYIDISFKITVVAVGDPLN